MRSIYHIREYNVRRLSLVCAPILVNENTLILSIYQLSTPDIVLSHDWPQSIEHHGDLRGLLRHKSFLRKDIETGQLGSPPMMGLLRTLKPQWWFSAHLHTRYEATVVHEPAPGPETNTTQAPAVEGTNPDEIAIDDLNDAMDAPSASTPHDTPLPPPPANPDEIKLDDEEEEVAPPPAPPPRPKETKFLALSKCLPGQRFLEVSPVHAMKRKY